MAEAQDSRVPDEQGNEAATLFPDGRNRLIEGDCLAVMGTLPERSIDLIYVDPPFFSGRDYVLPGAAPTAVPAFADRWPGHLAEYLGWLTPRLREMHRLLRPTGSLFVHLDWHAVHYVKCALDELFGYERFRNQIVWHYGSGGRARRYFPRKHDLILWYSRSERWTFDAAAVAVPRRVCPTCGGARKHWNHLRRHVADDGRVYRTIRSGGRVYRYDDDAPTLPPDVWLDLSHLQQRDPERLGYPTQKPLALLRRIVAACSRPGEIVADFCCGSGTTLAAAQQLGRRWIGCDAAPAAIVTVAARLAHAPSSSESSDGPPRRRARRLSGSATAPTAPNFSVERHAAES